MTCPSVDGLLTLPYQDRFLSIIGGLGAVFGLIIVILSSFDDPITDSQVSAAEDPPTTPEQAEISKNQQKLHCLGDYTYCTNEEVFLSAYGHWEKTDCKFEVKYEAKESTRYGRPWFSSLTSFPVLINAWSFCITVTNDGLESGWITPCPVRCTFAHLMYEAWARTCAKIY